MRERECLEYGTYSEVIPSESELVTSALVTLYVMIRSKHSLQDNRKRNESILNLEYENLIF